MLRKIVSIQVFILSVLSLTAGNTGKIADPDTNTATNSTCANDSCNKVVTHRCYCVTCDTTPSGSECPCVQNNSGQVQQTTYPGQCVEVTASVAAGYESQGKGFKIGVEASGKVKFCLYNSTPSTTVTTGPTCGI